MKMAFLPGFLMILFFDGNLGKEYRRNVHIDFKQPVIEVELDLNFEIELSSTKDARWIIPKRIRQFVKFNQSNNSLLIKIGNATLTNANENVSVCKLYELSKSVLETYDIPQCCPCCPWYNQNGCKLFYDSVVDCTTITLYYKTKLDMPIHYIIEFDNVMIQIPCQMRSSHLNYDLLINDYFSQQMYLKYENGTLEYKDTKFSYNPTSGLCLNTSNLQAATNYFRCQYSDGVMVFALGRLDFTTLEIYNSWAFINDDGSSLLFNDSTMNVLHKSVVRIRCQAMYSFYKDLHLLMCMSLEIVSNVSRNYNCKKFEEFLSNDLIIDSERIQNGSKLRCATINPSKDVSKEIETTIYKYNSDILYIKNYEFQNNKVYKVFSNNATIPITIPYYSIPSNVPINCTYSENSGLKLNIHCEITTDKQCVCQIESRTIIDKKLTVNVSIFIFNRKLKKSISIVLTHVYLKKPKLIGLTEKLEDHKNVYCQVEASEPVKITWSTVYDKKKNDVYYSSTRAMNIPIYTHSFICVKCSATNDAGTNVSDIECKQIVDVDINEKNTLQLFMINYTIFSDKMERISEMNFLGLKNNTVSILDYSPTFIKCASKIKGQILKLFVNQSVVLSKNIKNVSTDYTQQILYELDVNFLASQKERFQIFCHQENSFDSTYFINVIRTIIPNFTSNVYNIHKFLVGQSIHFTVKLTSFPPAELTLFKILKSDKNSSYYYSIVKNVNFKINRKIDELGHSEIMVTLFNLSQVNTGKYVIVASNIRGTSNYVFSLELWAATSLTLKVSIITGSLIMIILVILVFALCHFKRPGYMIPIIQIPNSIYKSLEENYARLPYMIWPDELERRKWTIQSSSTIQVKERIGGGNYGIIYTGVLKYADSTVVETVALKYPILSPEKKGDKTQAQFCQISFDCFINEIRILSQLTNCPNIIKMYGCTVLKDWSNEKGGINSPAMLVLEFCCNFSLCEFLIKNVANFDPYTKYRGTNEYCKLKMDDSITLLDLKRISLGIAIGLEYLSSLNIIHRDLASRNILVDRTWSPKICDFGLAIELDNDHSVSDSYQVLTFNKALPYKILAPEALESKIFYLESDIWSFSLLLWNIFNLDNVTPFPNIDAPSELLLYIRSNFPNLLPRPRYADEGIWKLIKMCWCLDHSDRPCASTVRNILNDIIQNSPLETILNRNEYYEFSTGHDNRCLMKYNSDSDKSNSVEDSPL